MNEKNFELSVVVPVTRMSGRLNNLNKMLDAVHHYNIQLVIVHDKRDDKTGPELQGILRNHENIELIEGVYGSAGAARNAGLTLVKSNWVSFWDSDDEPDVVKYMVLLEKIKTEKNLVGYGRFVKKSSENDLLLTNSNIKFRNNSYELVKNPGLWRWIFATTHIKNLMFPTLQLGEDICFLFSVLQITEKITLFEEVVYKYIIGHPLQSTQLWKNSSVIYLVVEHLNENFYHGQKNKNLVLGIYVNQLYSCLKRDRPKHKLISLKIFFHRFFNMTLAEKVISTKWLLKIPLNLLDT